MSFYSLLRQSVIIETPTGARDIHGKVTLGAPVTYRARVEKVSKSFINEQKEQVPYHASVMLPPTATVNRESRLTYSSDLYRVVAITEAPGRNGKIHHYELKCQLWSY